MKSFVFALVALLSATAFAQAPAQGAAPPAGGSDPLDPPECGDSCVLPEIKKAGCSTTDDSCICKVQAVQVGVKTCVPTKCDAAGQASWKAFVNDACKGAPGYPL